MICALYRHFDAAGDLLYVGVSLNAVGRLAQHRSSADWFDQIAKIEIEQFETRDLALAAEAAAINAERPKYNRVIPFTTGKPRQILSLDEQRQLIAELRASFPDHLAVQLALADYEVLAIEANRAEPTEKSKTKPKATNSRASYMREHRRKERALIRQAKLSVKV